MSLKASLSPKLKTLPSTRKTSRPLSSRMRKSSPQERIFSFITYRMALLLRVCRIVPRRLRSGNVGNTTGGFRMPTANDVIAAALTTSQMMLKRFLADLGPQEYLHRPTPKANCAAWIVGHLTLTDRNGLKRLGAAAPELPAGFDRQFSREEGCPEAGEFGDVSRLIPLFDENRSRLIRSEERRVGKE